MIEIGDEFYAIIKLGQHSKDLLGNECAGQRLGPFTATKIIGKYVETKDRMFYPADFGIRKIAGNNGNN